MPIERSRDVPFGLLDSTAGGTVGKYNVTSCSAQRSTALRAKRA